MLLAVLDQTIVATALPAIARDLGNAGSVSWAVSAYLITTVASAPIHGKLGDLYGRRITFLVAVSLFVVASALAGAADSIGMLIAMRALQGLGGGGLMNLATAAIADLVPAAERGRIQGYTGSVFAVGSIGGPLLGGLFSEHISWRWIFYVNVPVGLACMALVYFTFRVPHQRGTRHRIDFLGSALLSATVTGTLLITVWGGVQYAWGSPQILALFVGVLVTLVLFILQERRAQDPVLPLGLFRDPVFRLAVPSSALLGITLFGTIVFVPQYFETVRGTSPTLAGLALVPTMAIAVVAGVLSAVRVSATGRYKVYPVVGSLLVLVGFGGLAQLDASTPLWLVIAELLLLGVGIGLHMQLMVFIVQNALPHAHVGTATAATMFFRALGGAVGTALFSTLFVRGLSDSLTGSGVSAGEAYNVIAHHAGSLPTDTLPEVEAAFGESLQVVFAAATPFAAVMLLLACFIPSKPLRTSVRDTDSNVPQPALSSPPS